MTPVFDPSPLEDEREERFRARIDENTSDEDRVRDGLPLHERGLERGHFLRSDSHAETCPMRRALGRAGVECGHGFDVCPTCDPCTCGAPR